MTNGDFVKTMEKSGFNLNTIVALVSLAVIFSGIVTLWTQQRFQQEADEKYKTEHAQLHERTDETRIAQFSSIHTQLANNTEERNKLRHDLDNVIYRVAQLEKVVENAGDRLSRIAETYSNQFTGINTKLGAMEIQIALLLDALKRLERQERFTERSSRTTQPDPR